MANTLTAVIDKLLAQGLLALRQMAIMPILVNRGYEDTAAERGSTIDVPIPSAIVAQDVAPANVPPTTADVQPTSVPIALDQWKEAAFYLTDKDIMEAMNGTIPMQASEAIKALANVVDQYILGLYKSFYGFQGTPGVTPLASDTSDATFLGAILSNQLAPIGDRRIVVNPFAQANALNLRAFQDASWTGSTMAILQGQLSQRLGFDWFMDQNVPTHTAGTGTGYLVNNGAGYAIGTTTLVVDTGSGTLIAGDILTFAGHTQTYAVVSSVGGGTVTSIVISPGLVVAVADNVAITRKASHVVNLAFHRDAIAFANRPLVGAVEGLGAIISSAVDPVSKLTLRLEVSREHRRTRYAYDILYGAKVVRPELGARLAG